MIRSGLLLQMPHTPRVLNPCGTSQACRANTLAPPGLETFWSQLLITTPYFTHMILRVCISEKPLVFLCMYWYKLPPGMYCSRLRKVFKAVEPQTPERLWIDA